MYARKSTSLSPLLFVPLSVTFLFLLSCPKASAQCFQNDGNTGASRSEKLVTVSGCISQGVECFVLEPFRGGKKYSVARVRGLAPGEAYRISGTVSDVSVCQQGFPTLSIRRITKIKKKCG